jgi:hypothetical protein
MAGFERQLFESGSREKYLDFLAFLLLNRHQQKVAFFHKFRHQILSLSVLLLSELAGLTVCNLVTTPSVTLCMDWRL